MNLLLSLVYSLNTNRRKSMKQISNHNPELISSECALQESVIEAVSVLFHCRRICLAS